MTTDPRAQIAEGIKNKSDDEVIALLAEMGGGTEGALDKVFEGMGQALNPEAAQDAIIGYELKDGDAQYNYAVVVKDKTATIEKREPSDARVTLQLTVVNFLRLISGQLDGMQAFMSGKLKLKGDMMFAQQMQRMFR